MAAHQVNITDRAKRYRAQNNVTGPRKCVLCNSRVDLGVMHLTGNESHGEPANLAYGCRSCNAKLAVAFKAIGAGKPTNQYNPAKGGTPTFEQYAWAVSNGDRRHWVRGQGWAPGAHDEAGAIIHATPKHKRIEYAKRIARTASGTKRAAADDRWNPANPLFGSGRPRLFGTPYVPPKGGTGPSYVMPRRELKALEARERATEKREAARERREQSQQEAREKREAAIERKRADRLNAEFLKGVKERAKSATFKGRAIKQTEGGAWVVPSIDKESEFDTVQDAKAFITSWQRNPSYAQGKSTKERMEWLEADAKRILKSAAKHTKEEVAWAKMMLEARKANPASASAEVFEEFHGFKPSEVVTVTKRIHYHAQLAAAGVLTHLDVWGIDGKGHRISGFKGAFLAFNESKNQLFVEGGDQAVNLDDFGIDSPHELESLGELTDIGYQTNKTHLGDEGGEAVYVHKFRTTNDNGKHVTVRIARYPDLIYDVRNEQLLFSGGSYEILREGINK